MIQYRERLEIKRKAVELNEVRVREEKLFDLKKNENNKA